MAAAGELVKWEPRRGPSAAHPVLVCFPYAGGSRPSAFRGWPATVCGTALCTVELQHPLPVDARTGTPSIGSIAQAVRAELGELPDARRVVLLGHSLGALIAFEVARSYSATGDEPAMLVVSGCIAPSLRGGDDRPSAWALSDKDLILRVLELGQDMRALGLRRRFIGVRLPRLRAELECWESYVYEPTPRLQCSIVALSGRSDPAAPSDLMAPWRHESCGSFRHHIVDGGHFFIRSNRSATLSILHRELCALGTDTPLPCECATGEKGALRR